MNSWRGGRASNMTAVAPIFRPEATVCVNCRSYRALDDSRGECINEHAQTVSRSPDTGEPIWQKVEAGESCLLWQPAERRR